MKRLLRWLPIALSTLCLVVAPASAGALRLEPWNGHLSVGYAHLTSDEYSPGGAFSFAAGVDYPVSSGLRVGPTVGIALLGSHDVAEGSFIASLDYSLIDVALQAHWAPPAGPVTRVSIGPGLAAARAALQVGAGGASFLDYAVDEVRPELAVDLSALPRKHKLVGVGVEAGLRYVPVRRVDWILTTLRMTIHY
jgi:hypothetical protein